MIVVFAHPSHWLASVAYAAPVLVLLGWMATVRVRDLRARRRADTQA